MSLTGLQIFKHLPGGKKEKEANCKKCGFPTCMAYAMKLAKDLSLIDRCEYISEELRSLLEDAGQKQQEEIIFGTNDNPVKVGNETVMFRHEKTFVNPACIAIKLDSDDPEFDKKLAEIYEYSIERVGEEFKIEAIALFDRGNAFIEKAQKIADLQKALIIVSDNIDNIKSVLSELKYCKPIVYYKSNDTKAVSDLEKEFGVCITAFGNSIETLIENSSLLIESGAKQIILNIVEKSIPKDKIIETHTLIRRAAIEDKFKPLGFPVMSFVSSSGNVYQDAILASVLLCKYSNIIILESFNKALLSAIFALRQNIYTDPQKPLQVEPKIYEIGDVTKDSPVFVTTNFALTYFAVISEIEASGVPAYLLITPSDGMSVLTAWSASKFTGEIIAKAVRDFGLENLVNHRELIIPGFVSSLKEEIEEELPDWSVIIGTNEAIEISHFLNSYTITNYK